MAPHRSVLHLLSTWAMRAVSSCFVADFLWIYSAGVAGVSVSRLARICASPFWMICLAVRAVGVLARRAACAFEHDVTRRDECARRARTRFVAKHTWFCCYLFLRDDYRLAVKGRLAALDIGSLLDECE